MLLFLIRHGDPIYDPDSLTPLGERQAEAVAKRLALHGLDEIYTSPMNRAILTAKPTCELLRKEPKVVDFASEVNVWKLTTEREDKKGRSWLFHDRKTLKLFNSAEIRELGDRWYDHPAFAGSGYKECIDRIYEQSDSFLAGLGYEHIRYTGKYKSVAPNDLRIALFAHQGFGLTFLSCILDIPYPMFSTHFDISHSGMTVIKFQDVDGYAVPKVLTLSSDAHLYREGLPTLYNYDVTF